MTQRSYSCHTSPDEDEDGLEWPTDRMDPPKYAWRDRLKVLALRLSGFNGSMDQPHARDSLLSVMPYSPWY